MRESGIGDVPNVGTCDVVRQVVNSLGATEDAGEKGFKMEATRGRPRVAPGFDNLHRFMLSDGPKGLAGVSQIESRFSVAKTRDELVDVFGDMCLQVVRETTIENVLVGNLLHPLAGDSSRRSRKSLAFQDFVSSFQRSTLKARITREALPSIVEIESNRCRVPKVWPIDSS